MFKNSGSGVVDTGEAPKKSNISANNRKKITLVSRLVYWEQEGINKLVMKYLVILPL
jgi:hypothetical protein